MKKPSFFFACMIVLLVIAVWAPPSEAYNNFSGGCQNCHGGFRDAGYVSNTAQDGVAWAAPVITGEGGINSLHEGHAAMVSNDCFTCHQSTGDNPIIGGPSGDGFNSCVGCHGRDEDITTDDGAFGGAGPGRGDGLRAHHASSGISSCDGCHYADTLPVAENVPGARSADLGINPCTDAFFGMFGSDNDGNGLYDGEDLMACLAKGDINGSGVADLADVILSLQIAAGMTPAGTVHKEADINNDQKVGIPEAVWIMSNSGL